ncbi:helix-turn-helix domain-containing protein [Candidatus Micrarchaeota archaeon]|nr:helix-turn-helix domain-containing protein [Candidatus Micrarchaeota archaeon]
MEAASQNRGTEPPVVEAKKKTSDHYNQQKSQCFVYFRLKKDDSTKISGAQFTLYDFINNSFAFSPTKKQLTVAVLDALKEKPLTFNELVVKLNAKKSTLYLLCVALQKSGLIEQDGKNKPLRISGDFSLILKKYSDWWTGWVSR